ncbi:hypothetical protein CROQUDRAFT_96192 [Cronartium quercuum f. sp. fusiforme G11]|uniref:Uncharacterized protein n=1 Tax=Cronartium quercuum f. sp. fusiforme G11 TaxID=708437 RepID=A0A9P6NCP6_9BASI|nr:hypothetical protein CROQUDRAFT_96192 [Cronartium quercuum f. sp. fusiforme G11]
MIRKQPITPWQAFRDRLRKEGITVDFRSAAKQLDAPDVFPLLADYIQDTKRFPNL